MNTISYPDLSDAPIGEIAGYRQEIDNAAQQLILRHNQLRGSTAEGRVIEAMAKKLRRTRDEIVIQRDAFDESLPGERLSEEQNIIRLALGALTLGDTVTTANREVLAERLSTYEEVLAPWLPLPEDI